jgi:hypothetical protein
VPISIDFVMVEGMNDVREADDWKIRMAYAND